MLVCMSKVRSYHELLSYIDDIDPVEYAKTRNHLSGAVTALSPYISRGVLPLPLVRDRVLTRYTSEAAEKLIQELAWREYFQRVWWEKDEAIFRDLRFPRNDWNHSELVSAVVNANTGVQVLDDGVKQLYEEGYLHNHLRLWIASVSCNLAGAHWLPMGKWMYRHLIDGDLASNFLSWQWVAGTSVNKRYTTAQELLNALSDHQQRNTILSFDRDLMEVQPVPKILLDSEPVSLECEYPQVEDVATVSGATVQLYTPWTLNPTWRKGTDSRKILVIDPVWFDRFPVSTEVFDFIVRQGQTVIPDLEVFIGRQFEIPGIDTADQVSTIAHQTNRDWLTDFDEPEWLFPEVSGYYPSFFKYWQAVMKRYR